MGGGAAARAGAGADQDQGQGGRDQPDLPDAAGRLPQGCHPAAPGAVLGFEAAGTAGAAGPGVTGTSADDAVTALLFSLGGYAEYAVASIWARKPDAVSWTDAAALPSSAEAAAGVLRQLHVKPGETLLLFGGGGSAGVIATQLAAAQGITVISAVGEHDEALARELGATPVRYGASLPGRVRALGPVDAVFDAAGKGVLADAVALAGGPQRVITSAPAARTHHHAHAAGRRRPPPAGNRHPPPVHHPHPQLARAAQRRPAARDMLPGPTRRSGW